MLNHLEKTAYDKIDVNNLRSIRCSDEAVSEAAYFLLFGVQQCNPVASLARQEAQRVLCNLTFFQSYFRLYFGICG